jgi:uncharacterized tellurite resistance protein B-like protein
MVSTEKISNMITLSKTLAGYHILMIIASVDGNVSKDEEKIIRKYIRLNYSFLSNLDEETLMLQNLPQELYYNHFCKVAVDFYSQSNAKERMDLINFIMKIILADNLVSAQENKYLNELYNLWDLA